MEVSSAVGRSANRFFSNRLLRRFFSPKRKKMTADMTTRNRKTVIIYPLLLLFVITALLGVGAAKGASPVGVWINEDAQIEIFKDGGKLDGKIAALNEKCTKDGQKITDIHNPDPAKRERPLIGLV